MINKFLNQYFVFLHSGTGGTVSGISKYLKEQNDKILVVLGDPQGSALANKVNNNVIYNNEDAEGFRVKHPFDTITEGVGLNRLTNNFSLALIDKAFKVSDEECIHMANYLLENEGLFLGSSSALNLCAVVKAIRQFGEGKTIVTIFCDSGVRYISKFYNRRYLESKGVKIEPLDYKNMKSLDFIE